MRRRWKERFANRRGNQEDSPSDRPVSFAADAESGADGFELDPDWELCGSGKEQYHSARGLGVGLNALDADASQNKTAVSGPTFLHSVDDSTMKFVDGSKVQTSDTPVRFERVSAAAPPTIVSEAVRLTDKRAVLYPWEKGRLGRIFGEQGRLSLKKPKLHAGVNNFVEVGVEMDSGFKLGASVSVQQGTGSHRKSYLPFSGQEHYWL